MRRILTILLILISLAGHSQSRLQLNPLTGQLELSANIAYMADTLINLGGNVAAHNLVNGYIGYSNASVSENSMIVGFNSYAACKENFVLGSYYRCNSDYVVSIWGGNIPDNNRYIPGSVGIGYYSQRGALDIHSGYNNGDEYCGDKGGVLINRWRLGYGSQYYQDTLLSLGIYSHNVDGNSYMMKLKDSGGSERFAINDQGTTTVAGSLSPESVVSNYTPAIYHAAFDTTYIPVPNKVGDIYIDTAAKDVYISNSPSKGGWKKVN